MMMRNRPTPRRILPVVLVTSAAFAVAHLLTGANSANDPAYQILSNLGFGILMAAIYIRSGSNVAPIVLHAVFDLYAFTIGQLTLTEVMLAPVVFRMASVLLPYVLGFVLLRKKQKQTTVETWGHIWSDDGTCVTE